jgi:hypothetical protein
LSEPTDDEKRLSQRLPADQVFAAVTVHRLGEDQAFGVVLNVSETGLLVRTPQPPPVPSHCTLRVSVEEDVYEVSASASRVVSIGNGAYDVGFEISAADGQRIAFLKAFLVTRRWG